MIRINKAQFQENLLEWCDGVYIFELEDCTACERYFDILKKVKTNRKIYIIDCNEDLDFYISLGMAMMPETRLYLNGEMKFRTTGVPSDVDLEKFFYEELENCNS